MADGKYSNVVAWTDFILYNVPGKVYGVEKRWAKATRIGNVAFFEAYFKFGEDFAIDKPDVYNNDRFAVIMKHPLYQFAPINFYTKLTGLCNGKMYLQGGSIEGIYEATATVRLDKLRNWWVTTLWTNETDYKKNGRVEKVCLDWPHKGYQTWQGAELWVSLQYECAPVDAGLIDYNEYMEKLNG